MTDTITLPRSVVEQALEALKMGHESAHDCAETFHVEMAGYRQKRHDALDADVKQISDAIDALRAALEQQQGEQEPIAWANINKQGDITHTSNKKTAWAKTPLYTHPQPQPKREPLTDEAVLGVAKSIEIQFDSERLNEQIDDILAFARAIEHAHNIK